MARYVRVKPGSLVDEEATFDWGPMGWPGAPPATSEVEDDISEKEKAERLEGPYPGHEVDRH